MHLFKIKFTSKILRDVSSSTPSTIKIIYQQCYAKNHHSDTDSINLNAYLTFISTMYMYFSAVLSFVTESK